MTHFQSGVAVLGLLQVADLHIHVGLKLFKTGRLNICFHWLVSHGDGDLPSLLSQQVCPEANKQQVPPMNMVLMLSVNVQIDV